MRTLLAAVAALTLAAPVAALACEGEGHAAKTSVKKVDVTELTRLQKESKPVVVDVNGKETRSKYGVIPGAVLLTSAAKYEVAKELPQAKDAKLVFYCANTACTASKTAAERAAAAGYTDVAILPDGIQGWKGAGRPTALPQS